jgi:hypothetical protein
MCNATFFKTEFLEGKGGASKGRKAREATGYTQIRTEHHNFDGAGIYLTSVAHAIKTAVALVNQCLPNVSHVTWGATKIAEVTYVTCQYFV